MTKELYKIIEKNSDNFTVKLANKEHKIFKAHFPNYPILPGFLLIEIATEVLKDSPQTIKSAKFIAHSLPEDQLLYKITTKENTKKIKVFNKENTKVGEFSYE